MAIALNAIRYASFDLFFSEDFAATSTDIFNILELESASAIEATVGARIVSASDAITLGMGETTPAVFGVPEIKKGVWHHVELTINLDAGGGNDGAIDLFVTPEGSPTSTSTWQAQIGTLDQAAIDTGRIGVQLHLATTTGTMLIDNFILSSSRLNAPVTRYPETVELTKSGHAFVGPGLIRDFVLLSGNGTDCVAKLHDTDEAATTGAGRLRDELGNTSANERVDSGHGLISVTKGAYVELTGTDPRALVTIDSASAYGSPAAVRNYGIKA